MIADLAVTGADGAAVSLARYAGQVLLIVNTASQCGFTPQYDGLEALHRRYAERGLAILAFPCNQFGGQDPGSNEEIQNFCVLGHKVTYKVLGKTEVNGNGAEPVWEWMKKEKPGLMGLQRVKWNFEKFLIGKDGKVKGRWASTTKPEGIKSAIEAEFKAKA